MSGTSRTGSSTLAESNLTAALVSSAAPREAVGCLAVPDQEGAFVASRPIFLHAGDIATELSRARRDFVVAQAEETAAKEAVKAAQAAYPQAQERTKEAERVYALAMLAASGFRVGDRVHVQRDEGQIIGLIARPYLDGRGMLRVTIQGRRPGRGYLVEQIEHSPEGVELPDARWIGGEL